MPSKNKFNFGALIMAAGGSSRLDSPKQLLKWGGAYLVNHIVRVVSSAGIDSIYMILGFNYEEIRQALDRKDLHIILNTDWNKGLSSSIKSGIEALDKNIDAAFILLVDQPFVTNELLKQMTERMAAGDHQIVAPRINGQQSNPVLFERSFFPRLLEISGDRGAKSLLKDSKVEWVDWPDERLIVDIDSQEDYQAALRLKER